jgi:hypothetical protein
MDTNHVVLQKLLAAEGTGEAVVLATVVKAGGGVTSYGDEDGVYEFLKDERS